MDVFVIPVGPDRYELYCEVADADSIVEPPKGVFGRLGDRFKVMLRAAEARQQGGSEPQPEGLLARLQDRLVAWVAERVAEQRLLWNLRRESAAIALHPEDLTADQAIALVRRILGRDYERHKVWLVVDSLGLIVSALLAIIPGPNIVAYYFAFRVVGHWLSMRGRRRGFAVSPGRGDRARRCRSFVAQ